MSAEKKALAASIAHWQRLYELVEREWKDSDQQAQAIRDEGWYSDDCPLCRLFFFVGDDSDEEDGVAYDDDDRSCDGCPVARQTGESHCYKTPWSDAAFSIRAFIAMLESDFQGHKRVWTPDLRARIKAGTLKAVAAERDFLVSLDLEGLA